MSTYHWLDEVFELKPVDLFVFAQSELRRDFEDQSVVHGTGIGMYVEVTFEVFIHVVFGFHSLVDHLAPRACKGQWREAPAAKSKSTVILHDEAKSRPIDLGKESDVQSASNTSQGPTAVLSKDIGL